MATKTTKAPEVKKQARPAPAPKPEKVAQVDPRNGLQRRRTMTGMVVSDKMTKTIVVTVDRRVRHGEYGKYIVLQTRYKAHDEKNEAKIGDQVTLVESKPISKNKRWVLQNIKRRAGQVAEANV